MNENTLTDWSIRHAVFDVVERNILPIENKKQILNFIKEDATSEQLSCIFECLKDENNSENSSILNEMYYDHLKEKSDLPILNENKLNKMRDAVLMEADTGMPAPIISKSLTADDIVNLAKAGGIVYAVRHVTVHYAMKGDEGKKKLLEEIGKIGQFIDTTLGKTFIGKRLPPASMVGKILKKALQSPKRAYKVALAVHKKHQKNLKKVSDEAFKKMSPAAQKRIEVQQLAKKAFRIKSTKAILITSGVIAAIAAAYKTYQYYLSTKGARTHCNKFKGDEKTICMLKFQINAATLAITSLQDAKGGCSQKSNPSKCIYSINQEIWKWTQRKNKYIQRLNKLTKSEYKPETKKSKQIKDSPFD